QMMVALRIRSEDAARAGQRELPPRSRGRSRIDFAGGSDANAALTGSNSRSSAAEAMVSADASLLMYCVRFPGFGWLLIHCGPLPPLLFESRSIVSNMRASARGS